MKYERYALEGKSIGVLLNIVEQIASEEFDGHYTIYSFTTNYRAAFGTSSAFETQSVQPFTTLKSALIDAIVNKTTWK